MFPRARDPDVFPPTVSSFSVLIPADAAPDPRAAGLALPPSLARAVPKRTIQVRAGRFCAREAIRRLAPGHAAGTLPQDADGCPVWPPGLVGSISHTDAFATAAVSSSGAARGLGVDVEPVMSSEAAVDVENLVAAGVEIHVAREAGLSRLEGLTLIFSAKESVFKALFPTQRRRFDYLDCALAGVDPAARRFSIRLKAPFGAGELEGLYERIGGEIRTGVLVLPSR